ncbi:MAG: hypothetical protein [Wendovervirus sonii]|uniref:Uncharacterized protein n=1 Tax=phage Lak_Megaphage_Sonny TaxID=3109229 RepID=A0ABZ0Z372_9CAUD|nr:MAG: hypothetical protein [phage Lak_Megaphage_Sonny]
MKNDFYKYALYEFYQLSNNCFLSERLNEGLIKSYDVRNVCKFLNDKMQFPCVCNAKVLHHNTYESKKKALSEDEFVEIILNDDFKSVMQYENVVKMCYNLLGWFTGIIMVKIMQRNGGYKTYAFFRGEPYKKGNEYVDCFFSEDSDYELKKFLIANARQIYQVSLIIEEKFPIKQYKYDAGETFYHKTDKIYIDKIKMQGLVPKSRFNYPSRIYLTNNIEDLDDSLLNVNKETILKIKLKRGQKLYVDPRSPGFFTYDNISPDEIEII